MDQKRVREFAGFIDGRIKSPRHAVILAGGDGTRLRSLTRLIAGDERPKQFCPMFEEETLLDRTRARVETVIPAENTYLSLTKPHERYYKTSLWSVPEKQLIVQPENKGTAPAVLYSLLRLTHVSPGATAAFFPSDHYFADPEAFMANVESAFEAVEREPDSIVLLGIEPNAAETSYGWIEPVESLFGREPRSLSRVKRFWEKPARKIAEKLMKQGCLWNSFVMVGRVEKFLEMFRKHLPDMFRMFSASLSGASSSDQSAMLRSVYAWIEEANFSREVLEKESDSLMVLRVGDVGWCDWGEPARVLGTLDSLGVRADWMQAVAA